MRDQRSPVFGFTPQNRIAPCHYTQAFAFESILPTRNIRLAPAHSSIWVRNLREVTSFLIIIDRVFRALLSTGFRGSACWSTRSLPTPHYPCPFGTRACKSLIPLVIPDDGSSVPSYSYIACSILSRTVGIESGRNFPLALGISTRFVGCRFPPFQLLTRITLCSGVLIISLSIPAVALPLLVWVIRRTDNNRQEWLLCINFCKFLKCAEVTDGKSRQWWPCL